MLTHSESSYLGRQETRELIVPAGVGHSVPEHCSRYEVKLHFGGIKIYSQIEVEFAMSEPQELASRAE